MRSTDNQRQSKRQFKNIKGKSLENQRNSMTIEGISKNITRK